MSFYPQPGKYQCGPFALKYGLVMLGKFENEKLIGKRAGSSWWYGTDEIGLERAAKSFNCSMVYFKSDKSTKALLLLKSYLKQGIPCILSVDNWGHWFTVINQQNNKFIVVDSGLPKVITTYSSRQLIKRWSYCEDGSFIKSFDGYALFSNCKPLTKANFSLETAKYIMREENKDLAEKWDLYFNDLVAICKPKNITSKNSISFNEFIRRHESILIKEIADWHGVPSYKELKKILKNMQFVAEVYNLVIRKSDQKKALIDISALLMMYACGKYGMYSFY